MRHPAGNGARRPGSARRAQWLSATALLGLTTSYGAGPTPVSGERETLTSQREHILDLLARELHVDERMLERVRAIFEHSAILGQGNPSISVHAISVEEGEVQRRVRPLRPGDMRCGLTVHGTPP